MIPDACLSCFPSKRTDRDRESLLQNHQPESSPPREASPNEEPLNKIADVLAALSAGKLPSQTQINTFLRKILHSNILQESQHEQGGITPDILQGNGPLSRRGRKVTRDLVEVIQALLRFGMEKNDDDLVQDLFWQFSQIETDESTISLDATQAAPKKVREIGKQAGKLKEDIQNQVPPKSEVSEDAKTMVKAIRSLLATFLTSSAFRLILADAIVIGRALVANAVPDVTSDVLRAHSLVEPKPESGRSTTQKGDQQTASFDEEKGKAREDGNGRDTQDSVKEERHEWERSMAEADEEVKRILLTRIQEMVIRAQQDPLSRRAIITILHIIRKYAHKFALASQEIVTHVQAGVAGPTSDREESKPATSEGVPTGFADPPSYPPQPYGSPPTILIPGIEIVSPHLQHVLRDTKVMLERLAQGHKIDDLIKTFGEIVKHSVATPRSLVKSIEKIADERILRDEESSSTSTTKHTEHAHCLDEDDSEETVGTSNNDRHEKKNLFAKYFSNVGEYLDRALTRPGWAASKTGQKSLDTLYDATQELLRVAGEVIADAEEIAQEGVERAKDLKEAGEAMGNALADKPAARDARDQPDHSPSLPQKTVNEAVDHATHRWVKDITTFLMQAGDYVDAIERDRTTMKLGRALETLREDTERLLGVGKQEIGRATGRFKNQVQHSAQNSSRLGLYTQWLGWALPRLLHLFPLDAIPVPRVEVKTNNIECAFDARWIRGLSQKDKRGEESYVTVSGHGGAAPGASGEAVTQGSADGGGIGGKLVPDEVLIQQWTEVKVKFAEGLGAATFGMDDAQYRMGSIGTRKNEAAPGIEATSRLRMRMDGIKACVHGMGYYLRYDGAFFNYEDEGILSVDLGAALNGDKHSGLGLDVELEVDSSDVEMDLRSTDKMEGVPILIVEDFDTDTESTPNSDPSALNSGESPGPDVQAAIHEAAGQDLSDPRHTSEHPDRLEARDPIPEFSSLSVDLALTKVNPLFRVLNVQVDMRRLKFKIDKSRHWLFNKLIVQPFGASRAAAIARQALEERVRKTLEAISAGMALITVEAKERSENRRMKRLSEMGGVKSGTPESYQLEAEAEYGEMTMEDFYASLINRGPEILGYYTKGPEPSQRDRERRKFVHTDMHTELTRKGVVFSKQTHTHIQHQPGASKNMIIPPPGDEGNIEGLGVLRTHERGGDDSTDDEQLEELTVAVGAGAQLFPGKGGPYGDPGNGKDTGKNVLTGVREGVEELREDVQKGYQKVKGHAKAGKESATEAERRYANRKERERERAMSSWRSPAFDL